LNKRNYAETTNYIAGSSKLELMPFYLQSTNIPGMNFTINEISGRGGALLKMSADTIQYNGLSLTVLLDEDFKIYEEFYDIITKSINPNTGTFSIQEFDFWIELNNNKGNNIMKFEFENCKIESLGDIMLDSTTNSTNTFNIELVFDKMTKI
jgi:hypothetical protein